MNTRIVKTNIENPAGVLESPVEPPTVHNPTAEAKPDLVKSLPEIMAAAYGSYLHETQDDLGDVHAELRAILDLLDDQATQWGDEGVFRRCRDRLRKVVGE